MPAADLPPHARQLGLILARRAIDLVFDIGANVGQYATLLRRAGYGGRIVSVEPQSVAHAALVRAAGGDAGWTVAPRAAVGAKPGMATINLSAESDMSSLLPLDPASAGLLASSRFVGSEPVPMVTVDQLWSEHAGDACRVLLKCDTQGCEFEVLRGAATSLPRLAGVQAEVALHPVYDGQPGWRTIVDLLEGQGFTLDLVIPGYFSRHHGRMLEIDVVLFRAGSA